MLRRTTLAVIGLAELQILILVLTLAFGMWEEPGDLAALVKSFGPGLSAREQRVSPKPISGRSRRCPASCRFYALPGLAARLQWW